VQEEKAAEEDAAAPVAEASLPALGIEDALALYNAGNVEGLLPHLASLAAQLMPLLRLIDAELRLGMSVNEAEEKLKKLV
jgi:hypothetical protein